MVFCHHKHCSTWSGRDGMKPLEEKLFVLVEPGDEHQHALQRAIGCARLRSPAPVVSVYVARDGNGQGNDGNGPGTSCMVRDQHWFDREVYRPLDEAGLLYESAISWHGRWPRAGLQAAEQFGADMIFMPSREHHPVVNPLLQRGRWSFLGYSHCPLMLVRGTGDQGKRQTVLAAVNFQASRPEQIALNERILGYARREANLNGAHLHVVNAYLDSMNYPDRGRLARETGLSTRHVHVRSGYTDQVIAAAAQEFGADMVVLGTINQRGNQGSLRRGNTTARVLAALDPDVDVLVVN